MDSWDLATEGRCRHKGKKLQQSVADRTHAMVYVGVRFVRSGVERLHFLTDPNTLNAMSPNDHIYKCGRPPTFSDCRRSPTLVEEWACRSMPLANLPPSCDHDGRN
jgi:hypothetical protein